MKYAFTLCFIGGLLFGMADADNDAMFMMSKVIAIALLGAAYVTGRISGILEGLE